MCLSVVGTRRVQWVSPSYNRKLPLLNVNTEQSILSAFVDTCLGRCVEVVDVSCCRSRYNMSGALLNVSNYCRSTWQFVFILFQVRDRGKLAFLPFNSPVNVSQDCSGNYYRLQLEWNSYNGMEWNNVTIIKSHSLNIFRNVYLRSLVHTIKSRYYTKFTNNYLVFFSILEVRKLFPNKLKCGAI